MQEICITSNVEHDIEFFVAAFGQTTFKCKLCGLFIDEYEDATP